MKESNKLLLKLPNNHIFYLSTISRISEFFNISLGIVYNYSKTVVKCKFGTEVYSIDCKNDNIFEIIHCCTKAVRLVLAEKFSNISKTIFDFLNDLEYDTELLGNAEFSKNYKD